MEEGATPIYASGDAEGSPPPHPANKTNSPGQYKIGKRKGPKVLQGVFSGVSTTFDPIGGRAVLIRTEEAYESLKNNKKEIAVLKKSKVLEDRRLAEYFKDYCNNNVAPGKSYTFGLDDLGDCK